MANLLGRTPHKPYPPLDVQGLARLRDRLQGLWSLPPDQRLSLPSAAAEALEAELDELANEVAPETAHALLDRIDRLRHEILTAVPGADRRESPWPPDGALLCHRPGRSLATGEASVASQGFYDALDRPPPLLWLEAIARPGGQAPDRFEVAVIVWVPGAELARARAGRRACSNDSLAWLAEASDPLASQLEPLLREIPP